MRCKGEDESPTSMTSRDEPRVAGVIFAATAGQALAALPVFLIGAVAVLMRSDLDFSQQQLGIAVSIYFGLSAVLSLHAGRLGERLGPNWSMALALTPTVVSLLGVALVARTYAQMLVFLGLGALGSALMQPATNLALALGIPHEKQGIAFGLKQAAVPMATTIAGLSVPLLAITLGWRSTYVATSVLVVLGLVYISRQAKNGDSFEPGTRRRATNRPLLVITSAAGFCGMASATAANAFYVESAVAGGMAPGLAGLLLSVGGATAIFARVASGWVVDRRLGLERRIIPILQLTGAVGFIAMGSGATTRTSLAILVTLLIFGAGWGWNGMMHLMIIRNHPEAPAAATGFVSVGLRGGGIGGPMVFGTLAEFGSYDVAWRAGAASLTACALLLWLGPRLFGPDLGPPRYAVE